MTKKITANVKNIRNTKVFGPFTVTVCELISDDHRVYGNVTGIGYNGQINFTANRGDLEVSDRLLIHGGEKDPWFGKESDCYVPDYIPTEVEPLDWDAAPYKEQVMRHLWALAESTK